MVKVGEPIQLNFQLDDGNPSKFPIAILRNAFGVPLSGSPVSLTHVGDGLYCAESILMPNTYEVTATFKVFDDPAHTVLSTFYSIELDVFERDDISEQIAAILAGSFICGPMVGDVTGYVDDTEQRLSGFVDDYGLLLGDIFDSGDLVGKIDPSIEIYGKFLDAGELVGIVTDC